MRGMSAGCRVEEQYLRRIHLHQEFAELLSCRPRRDLGLGEKVAEQLLNSLNDGSWGRGGRQALTDEKSHWNAEAGLAVRYETVQQVLLDWLQRC